MSKNDFKKLEEAKAASDKAFEELKATVDNSAPAQDLINRVMAYLQTFEGRMGYLQDTVMNHRDDFNQHVSQGHLPPIKSREHMDRAIKKLGLDEEYQAAPKKVVYANTKLGPQAVIGNEVDI